MIVRLPSGLKVRVPDHFSKEDVVKAALKKGLSVQDIAGDDEKATAFVSSVSEQLKLKLPEEPTFYEKVAANLAYGAGEAVDWLTSFGHKLGAGLQEIVRPGVQGPPAPGPLDKLNAMVQDRLRKLDIVDEKGELVKRATGEGLWDSLALGIASFTPELITTFPVSGASKVGGLADDALKALTRKLGKKGAKGVVRSLAKFGDRTLRRLASGFAGGAYYGELGGRDVIEEGVGFAIAEATFGALGDALGVVGKRASGHLDKVAVKKAEKAIAEGNFKEAKDILEEVLQRQPAEVKDEVLKVLSEMDEKKGDIIKKQEERVDKLAAEDQKTLKEKQAEEAKLLEERKKKLEEAEKALAAKRDEITNKYNKVRKALGKAEVDEPVKAAERAIEVASELGDDVEPSLKEALKAAQDELRRVKFEQAKAEAARGRREKLYDKGEVPPEPLNVEAMHQESLRKQTIRLIEEIRRQEAIDQGKAHAEFMASEMAKVEDEISGISRRLVEVQRERRQLVEEMSGIIEEENLQTEVEPNIPETPSGGEHPGGKRFPGGVTTEPRNAPGSPEPSAPEVGKEAGSPKVEAKAVQTPTTKASGRPIQRLVDATNAELEGVFDKLPATIQVRLGGDHRRLLASEGDIHLIYTDLDGKGPGVHVVIGDKIIEGDNVKHLPKQIQERIGRLILDSSVDSNFQPFKRSSLDVVPTDSVPDYVIQATNAIRSLLKINKRVFLYTVEDLKPDAMDALGIRGIYKRILIGDPSMGTRLGVKGRVEGAKVQFPNGDLAIFVSKDAKPEEIGATLAHELGHAFFQSHFDSATEATKKALLKAWQEDLEEALRSGRLGELAERFFSITRTNRVLEKRSFNDPISLLEPDFVEYLTSFVEWQAEQVVKWMHSQKEPSTLLGKYFKKLGEWIKEFVGSPMFKRFLPNKTAEEFITSVVGKTEPIVKVDRFYKDAKARLRELDAKVEALVEKQLKQGLTNDERTQLAEYEEELMAIEDLLDNEVDLSLSYYDDIVGVEDYYKFQLGRAYARIERDWAKFAKGMIERFGEEVKSGLRVAWDITKSSERIADAAFVPQMRKHGDPNIIVHQRRMALTKKGTKVPMTPISLAEANMLESIKKDLREVEPLAGPVEKGKELLRTVSELATTPARTFEMFDRANGTNFKELLLYSARTAEGNAAKEYKALSEQFDKVISGLSEKSLIRIGVIATTMQEGGAEILSSEAMKKWLAKKGIVKLPRLTKHEWVAYRYMQVVFEHLWPRINEARVMNGKKPIGKVDSYFSFIRLQEDLAEMGMSVLTASDKAIGKVLKRGIRSTVFHFEKRRRKGGPPIELNAAKVFKTYLRSALKHIHVSPVVAKARELNTKLRFYDENGNGYIYTLGKRAPQFARFLHEWTNTLAGVPASEFFRLPPIIDRAISKLSRNLTFATLAGNVHSIIIQPSALINTVATIGYKWTGRGISRMISKADREFAYKNSDVLIQRAMDVSVFDTVEQKLLGKAGGLLEEAGRLGLKPLQWLDSLTATATWLGAHEKATSELGLKGRDAVRYADDVVVRTQGSAAKSELAPIQRTALGKALTLYQTFVINQWDLVTKDLRGKAGVRHFDKANVWAWLSAAALTNIFYEEVLGTNSPNPTPVRAVIDTVANGGSVADASLAAAKELTELMPGPGGGFRYGTSPLGAVAQYGQDVVQRLSYAKGPKKSLAYIIATGAGIPLTAQLRKSIRAAEAGEGLYGILMGVHPNHRRYLLQALDDVEF